MRLGRAVLAGLRLAATTAPAAQAAPELSTSDRLADRRYVAAAERAQIEGFQTAASTPTAGTSRARWAASGRRR